MTRKILSAMLLLTITVALALLVSNTNLRAKLGKTISTQEQPPAPLGTLLWRVQQARAQGKSEVTLSSIDEVAGVHNANLCDAIAHYSIIRARPIFKKSYPQDYSVVTWNKFQILEVISAKPAIPCNDCVSTILPPDDFPVYAGEILIPSGGGSITLDNMPITHYAEYSPTFSTDLPEYVLFLDWNQENRFAYINTRNEGTAVVNNGYLSPNAPDLPYLGFIFAGLTERYGNTGDALALQKLRDYISSGCTLPDSTPTPVPTPSPATPTPAPTPSPVTSPTPCVIRRCPKNYFWDSETCRCEAL